MVTPVWWGRVASSGSAVARVAAVTPGVGRGKPGVAVSSQTAAYDVLSAKSTGVTLGETDQSRKARPSAEKGLIAESLARLLMFSSMASTSSWVAVMA